MIDHLMVALDEASLIAAIGGIIPDGRAAMHSEDGGWRGDIAFSCSVTDNTDPENPIVLSNFHLWVGLPSKCDALASLPCCVLVGDRDAALRGDPAFILQASLTRDQMQVYSISPVVAGSNYPFGAI